MIINFFGLILFYCPCLILHLTRIKENRSCLFTCFSFESKGPPDSHEEKINKNISQQVADDEEEDEVDEDYAKKNDTSIHLNNQSSTSSSANSSANSSSASSSNNQNALNLTSQSESQDTASHSLALNSSQMPSKEGLSCKKVLRKTSFSKIIRRFFKSNLLFESKLKYVVLLAFMAYLVFNVLICSFYSLVDLPLDKLIPKESYLTRHMENHVKYFSMGPVLMLNFIKPLNYTENATLNRVQSFLDDIKNTKGISKFEINWLDETIQKSKENTEYYPDCRQNNYGFKCFYQSLKEVLSLPQNANDVNYVILNGTNQSSNELLIKSSRVYLQMANFTGSMQDLELMTSLKALASEKHSFTSDSFIIFSVVFKYLEEMSEIYTSFISMFLLAFECLFFGGLFLFFDLWSVFILMLVCASAIISIFANVFLFNITLNIVTLFQFIMIPSILFEFFLPVPYLFLYSSGENRRCFKKAAPLLNNKTSNVSLAHSTLKKCHAIERGHRIKNVQFVCDTFSRTSCSFLFFNVFFAFIFMFFCTTYNFHTLFIILISTCFNVLVHVSLFYPVLLACFGTYWPNRGDQLAKKNQVDETS